MSDDVLDRLEAQLLEAAARRPLRRRRATPALAVAAGVLAVLLVVGGVLALVGRGGGGSAPRSADAGRPQGRTTQAGRGAGGVVPLLQGLGRTRTSSTPPTGAIPPPNPGKPARFAAQQLPLCPEGGAPARATGTLTLDGGEVSLQASGLPRSNRYLVWFFNRVDDAVPVGYAQFQPNDRTLRGGIQGLPREAQKYHSVIVTREARRTVSKPRDVVLRSTRILEGQVGRQAPC